MPDSQPPTTPKEGEAPPPATSAASQGTLPQSQSPGQPTGQPAAAPPAPAFTQEDMDKIMGKTRTEARDRATQATLDELGFKDLEKAKAAMAAWKTHQQAQMTELEQAQQEATRLQGVDDQLKANNTKIEELNTLIEAQVAAQVKQMDIPAHVLPLLEAMPLDQRLAYLTEHGEKFTKQAAAKPPKTNAGSKGGSGSDDATRKKGIHSRYGIQ